MEGGDPIDPFPPFPCVHVALLEDVDLRLARNCALGYTSPPISGQILDHLRFGVSERREASDS